MVKEKNYDKINHNMSEHAMGLQISNYLTIETETDRLAKMSKMLQMKQNEKVKENADEALKIN